MSEGGIKPLEKWALSTHFHMHELIDAYDYWYSTGVVIVLISKPLKHQMPYSKNYKPYAFIE